MQRFETERTDWAKSLRCDRGAVMVATIFMTLLLVAALYMVIGLGRTLVMKEGMQDAADAAAYSSAIFNARGMNLIVFINLLMAVLVAVLIAIRLAQTFLVLAAGILAAAAVASWGATGPLAAQATHAAVQMGDKYKQMKDIIFPILEVLHKGQVATSVVVPWVAMTRGMVEAAQHHEPAEGAFAIPGSFVLPVESDDYSRLCGEGADFLVGLAFSAFPAPVERFGELIGDEADGIAQSTSAFLCGSGDGASPTHTQTTDRVLPRHPEEADCQEEGSSECLETVRFLEKATPLEITGDCREDCGYDGPYEWMARRARLDCVPEPFKLLDNYLWHERTVEADFESNGVTWIETARRPGRLFLKGATGEDDLPEDAGDAPCGPGGTVDDEWNTDSGFRGAAEPRPVCVEEPEELREEAEAGARKTVEFREVVRIFSCTETVTRQIELASGDQALGGSGSEARSPHRVEEDLELGEEPFQIRAIAFGAKPGPGEAAQGVTLAHRGEGSWEDRWEQSRPAGEGEVGDFLDGVSEVSRVAVAQAEFYFDGSEGHTEWMWQMKWTARLRHFRLPTPEEERERDDRNRGAASEVSEFGGISPDVSPESACEAAGGEDCHSNVGAATLLDEIVKH